MTPRRPFACVGPGLIALSVGYLSLGSLAAHPQSLEGGCTVSANTPIDTTVMTDATRADPFLIDPEASISWNAASGTAIMNHTPG